MSFSRRELFGMAPVALAATAALIPAPSRAATTDLAVSCDTAAAPAVIAAGRAYRAKSGIRIRVFPTAPGLILPQIEREIQNDIIVTQLLTIERAAKENLILPNSRTGTWRNRLVTAAATQPAGPDNSFVVPDASPASDIDGAAILQRLGTTPAIVLGVIDTAAVAWTLTNAGARQGLLHQTEVTADDRLHTIAPVPDSAWPPILYAATITKLAYRGDPPAFIAFLDSPEGRAVMQAAGLETAA